MPRKRRRAAHSAALQPVNHSISIHQNLTQALSPFLKKEKLSCQKTELAVAFLVGVLSDYKEEGHRLFPEIFIFDEIENVLGVLPNSERIHIGSGPKTGQTLKLALKRCGPLSQFGWSIYVHRRSNTFDYGLLRCGLNALSLTASELLVENGDESLPVVLIRHTSLNEVEISGSCESTIRINFGAGQQPGQDARQAARNFCSSLVARGPVKIIPQLYNFYWRIFAVLPRTGHGCLAAVLDVKKRKLPPQFRDGVELVPHFDIPAKLLYLLEAQNCEADTQLRATAALIKGMLQADGVTVFGADGSVWAYNVFVKSLKKKEKHMITFGGARRRAFSALCSMVGNDLHGAFFLSQDGNAEFQGSM